ncbi:CHAT domain-containing protein [Dactylosporangium sp. CA-092794]|uniref:CHAT domain-containing protein n=1 Tax=Dactylosporangium sp. CA-092794 TaxID=3239929 RepID=UPI003D916388
MKLPWRRGGRGSAADHFRAAFRAGMSSSTFSLTQLAAGYQAWAEQHGSAQEQAEAAWLVVVGAARDSAHRRLPADRDRLLATAQSSAAEAGLFFSSTRPERFEDAVVALEHSRAVVLTRQLGHLEPATRDLLLQRGDRPLLNAYLAALRRRGDALRRQYRDQPEAEFAIRRGDAAYGTGTLSPLEQAQAELVGLIRRIQDAVGDEHFLDIPKYASIQAAARYEPLLYIATTASGGYALLVPATGRPEFIPLPSLTDDWLHAHAEAHVDPEPCINDLAEALGPALRSVPAAGIALIPIGGLAALPVHAAVLQATAQRPAGPLAPRYLPNARFRQIAAPRTDGGTLIIGVGVAPGVPPLPRAAAEARYLQARFGGVVVPSPTTASVLQGLGTADLVHFICHGLSRIDDPLAGGLALTDGLLSVQMMMAQPPLRSQLVLIAACEVAQSGRRLPDEVVGLPSALLQAGASAVVSALWPVDDAMAFTLHRRVRELLRAGRRPAVALAQAQLWLRVASREELQALYPDLHRPRRAAANPRIAAGRAADIPYRASRHWAAFTYTGL